MLSVEDKASLFDRIQNEGFEYALLYYSEWKSIKDDKFHELRNAYESARGKAQNEKAKAALVAYLHEYSIEQFK